MRYLFMVIAVCLPNLSWAKVFDPYVTLKDIGPLKVGILDNASGGCWTNMKEAKNYAEGKLEIAGADLSYVGDEPSYAGKHSHFWITVYAVRLSNGLCVGHAEIFISGYFFSDVKHKQGPAIGILRFSEQKYWMRNGKNMNTQVLDAIKTAVGEWEDRE